MLRPRRTARLFGARISLKERGDIFRLGDRGSILGQVGTAGLVASVLEQTDKVWNRKRDIGHGERDLNRAGLAPIGSLNNPEPFVLSSKAP